MMILFSILRVLGSLCESFTHDCLKHLPQVRAEPEAESGAASGLLARTDGVLDSSAGRYNHLSEGERQVCAHR